MEGHRVDCVAGPSSIALAPSTAIKYDVFLTHDWGTDEMGRDNHVRVSKVWTT